MKLCMVIPCYNEEEVLLETAARLSEKYDKLIFDGKISSDSRIVFVDDGSKDRTWAIISRLSKENVYFEGLKLSRNRGHQNALLAGLLTVKDKFDAVISMDADLQDDINAIDKMIESYCDGNDIVYGVRSGRRKDSCFKRWTAQSFYKVMKWMGAETVYNHADFRLMSRRALDALAEFSEVNLFLRGMVPLIGFKSDTVYYERSKRFAGKSKYPFRKMLSFAFEGITSLSIRPIDLIIRLGILLCAVGVGILIYALIQHFLGHTTAGWTSLMASIWTLGGIQLSAIGVIGKYIGKIYLETKHRPRYIIEKNTMDEDK
ncbi:MAG: glycosyltransferase family 2 protein [Clostridia bacterium]|nr:glycosyltransferase family 2 protein [Clostridia bacterium]